PIARDLRQQMMRHLFLVEDRRGIRNGAGELRDDCAPVRFPCCDDFVCAWMGGMRLVQIKRVEGLVHHNGIGTIGPRSHHRGRDVTGPRPHRDPHSILCHSERRRGSTNLNAGFGLTPVVDCGISSPAFARFFTIMATRTGSAVWNGTLKGGSGTMKLGSGAYEG